MRLGAVRLRLDWESGLMGHLDGRRAPNGNAKAGKGRQTFTHNDIPLILRHVIRKRISGYTTLQRFKHNSLIITEKRRGSESNVRLESVRRQCDGITVVSIPVTYLFPVAEHYLDCSDCVMLWSPGGEDDQSISRVIW